MYKENSEEKIAPSKDNQYALSARLFGTRGRIPRMDIANTQELKAKLTVCLSICTEDEVLPCGTDVPELDPELRGLAFSAVGTDEDLSDAPDVWEEMEEDMG